MVVGTDAEDSLPILVSPSQADVPIPCWCPHLMLVSPSQADIPIPGQCLPPRLMSPCHFAGAVACQTSPGSKCS